MPHLWLNVIRYWGGTKFCFGHQARKKDNEKGFDKSKS